MVRFHRHSSLLWILCFASFAVPAAQAALQLEPVISGLNDPVRLVAPRGDHRLFVVERVGRVRVFDSDGGLISTFLDITSLTSTESERGLLGLAFPPDYAVTGRFYVSYTQKTSGASVLARYTVSADSNVADVASAELLFTLGQPAPNHNGGHIEFGADGMLYFGFGDGGGAGDTANNAQNDLTWLGKLLRLDVSGASGYRVPPDNPYVGLAPADEIWAKGLRNPWCFSFDRLTGDLYIADVGQNAIEEVDVQHSGSSGGANYGWRLMEGTQCFNPSSGCDTGNLVLPVHEYTHGGSPFRCSISGGYVYRGRRAPSLQGRYLFADFCSDQIWSLLWSASGGAPDVVDHTPELNSPTVARSIAAFGQDGLGELYVLDLNGGAAYRIIDPTVTAVDGGQSFGGLKARW